MKPIVIGKNANNEPIEITPKMRESTHMHVIGGSGKGKSKFLEWLIRKDIDEGHGFCLIDWHGTLYKEVINYCCDLRIGLDRDFRSLRLLNPSRPDFITGFNPFVNQGEDISVDVSNRIAATIRPWGITDTNEMPTFERVLRLVYTFAAEQQIPLWNAQKLLPFQNAQLRDYAIEVINDPFIREQWQQLHQLNKRDWEQFVLSTENRLSRFLSLKGVRRFMNLTEGNIDLRDIMDNQRILLINLGASGSLDRESAKLFASLFLNEFFQAAMLRANDAPAGEKPNTFVLYLDEFQEYITEDIAAMLEQVRKGGLHIALAHQNLGQLLNDQHLLEALLGSARLRVAFGGLSYNTASFLGNEMFLPDLNQRQIKKAYFHTINIHHEETRRVTNVNRGVGQSKGRNSSQGIGSAISTGTSSGSGHNSSDSHTSGFNSGSGTNIGTSKSLPGSQMTVFTPFTEGWFGESESRVGFSSNSYSDSHGDSFSESYSQSASESSSEFSSEGTSEGSSHFKTEGEAIVPVWVPIPVQELTNEVEWSREEKLSRVAEMLMTQQEQTAFVKLGDEKTQPLLVPFVRGSSPSPEYLLEYQQEVYEQQGALPADRVDHLITENERKFLATAAQVIDVEFTELPESTVQTPKPKKQRSTRSKKATGNLFDTIKKEDE